jgi:hypothetical protein
MALAGGSNCSNISNSSAGSKNVAKITVGFVWDLSFQKCGIYGLGFNVESAGYRGVEGAIRAARV